MANQVLPKRMNVADAAFYLGIARSKLLRWVFDGTFTVQKDAAGRSAPSYLLTDELDVWAETLGDPEAKREAVRKFRLEKGRLEQ